MISRKQKLVAFFSFILIIVVSWGLYELQYINRTAFLLPISCGKQIILRNDDYGKGHFAARRNGGRKHNGIDIMADIGTPVLAARSGRVINAEKKRGLGKYVEIKHSKGLVTIYAHLSGICVKNGQRVRQGQLIGYVGKTGNANYKRIQSHLHFEIRKHNIPLDPQECFKGVSFREG